MDRYRILIKYLVISILLVAASFVFQPREKSVNEEVRDEMQLAFSGRKWAMMDSLYKDSLKSPDAQSSLSSRDISLYINALWIQGRYGEVTELMGGARDNFPLELKPYADMLMMLGLERTGRKDEAYKIGLTLEADAPDPLKYYLFYALGRISKELYLTNDALEWFRMMYKCAPDRSRRVQALRQMVAMPGVLPSEAARLLLLSTSDSKAYTLCSVIPAGEVAIVDYAVGYREYVKRNLTSAMERFSLASADKSYGEASRFYYAYSAYRLKSDDIALDTWSALALTGTEYSKRAVQCLTSLGLRGNRKESLEVLKSVADTRAASHDISAEALVGILKIGDKEEARSAMSELLAKHPASDQALLVRWEEGWRAWKSGNSEEADKQWSEAMSHRKVQGEMASRLLYWRYRALFAQNKSADALAVKRTLIQEYPSEYYTFLADSGGGISSNPIPESYVKPSLLELWGFLTYARLDVTSVSSAKRDIAAMFSAVRLAIEDGDFSSAVRSFEVLRRAITAGELASADLLRCSFPRPFERDVIEASEKTGVDPAIIWGIMRKESLFESDVTSSAGAYGLMQLMPGTAKGEAVKMNMSADSYKQVSGNILLGASHIAGLISRFGDLPRALAAYNAGSAPVKRWSREPISDMAEWVEDIGYNETRNYVKAVMRNIQTYRLLYPQK